jgi:hypothetical protein
MKRFEQKWAEVEGMLTSINVSKDEIHKLRSVFYMGATTLIGLQIAIYAEAKGDVVKGAETLKGITDEITEFMGEVIFDSALTGRH